MPAYKVLCNKQILSIEVWNQRAYTNHKGDRDTVENADSKGETEYPMSCQIHNLGRPSSNEQAANLRVMDIQLSSAVTVHKRVHFAVRQFN